MQKSFFLNTSYGKIDKVRILLTKFAVVCQWQTFMGCVVHQHYGLMTGQYVINIAEKEMENRLGYTCYSGAAPLELILFTNLKT